MRLALEGEDRIDEAVVSVPGDGIVRSDFGRVIDKDYSTTDKERKAGMFPLRLLYADAMSWLFDLPDRELAKGFNEAVIKPAPTYNIPAIELDNATSKSAVATVFEKVNTGGLALNVFELLTATFAGDKTYFDTHGTDFRLNDDWKESQTKFASYPVLAGLENTDFLQAVSARHAQTQPCRQGVPTSGHLRQARRRAEADARRLLGVGRTASRGVHLGLGLPGRPAHLRHTVPEIRANCCSLLLQVLEISEWGSAETAFD